MENQSYPLLQSEPRKVFFDLLTKVTGSLAVWVPLSLFLILDVVLSQIYPLLFSLCFTSSTEITPLCTSLVSPSPETDKSTKSFNKSHESNSEKTKKVSSAVEIVENDKTVSEFNLGRCTDKKGMERRHWVWQQATQKHNQRHRQGRKLAGSWLKVKQLLSLNRYVCAGIASSLHQEINLSMWPSRNQRETFHLSRTMEHAPLSDLPAVSRLLSSVPRYISKNLPLVQGIAWWLFFFQLISCTLETLTASKRLIVDLLFLRCKNRWKAKSQMFSKVKRYYLVTLPFCFSSSSLILLYLLTLHVQFVFAIRW